MRLLILLTIFFDCIIAQARMITNLCVGGQYIDRDISFQINSYLSEASTIINLYGKIGSGRLSAVKKHLKETKVQYDIIWLVDSSKEFYEFYELYNYLKSETRVRDINNTENRHSITKRILSDEYSWLLIFQNSEDYHEVKKYIPPFSSTKHSNVVVISYKKIPELKSFSLDSISKEEAKKLLIIKGLQGDASRKILPQVLKYSQGNISVLSQAIDLYMKKLNIVKKNGTDFIELLQKTKMIVHPDEKMFHFLYNRHKEKLTQYIYLSSISQIHPLSLIHELDLENFVSRYISTKSEKGVCNLETSFANFSSIIKTDQQTKKRIYNKILRILQYQDSSSTDEREEFWDNYVNFFFAYNNLKNTSQRSMGEKEYEVISHMLYELNYWEKVKSFFMINYKRLLLSDSKWSQKLLSVYIFGLSQFDNRHKDAIKILDLIISKSSYPLTKELMMQKAQVLMEINRMQEAKEILDKISIHNKSDFNYGLYQYLRAFYLYYHGKEAEAVKEINKIKNLENHNSGLAILMLRDRALSGIGKFSDSSFNLTGLLKKRKIKNKECYLFINRALKAKKHLHVGELRRAEELIARNKADRVKLPKRYKSYLIESDLIEGELLTLKGRLSDAREHFLKTLVYLMKSPFSKNKYYRECYFQLARISFQEGNKNDLFRYISFYKKYSFIGDENYSILLSYVTNPV